MSLDTTDRRPGRESGGADQERIGNRGGLRHGPAYYLHNAPPSATFREVAEAWANQEMPEEWGAQE